MQKKTIERTEVIRETVYEAIDGTIFNNEEECRSYDGTCIAIIKARFFAFSKEADPNSKAYNAIVGTEQINEDYSMYRSTPKTQADCDTIVQFVNVKGRTNIALSTPSTWKEVNSCEIVPNETYLVCVQDYYGCVFEEKKLLNYLTEKIRTAFHGSLEPEKEEEKK